MDKFGHGNKSSFDSIIAEELADRVPLYSSDCYFNARRQNRRKYYDLHMMVAYVQTLVVSPPVVAYDAWLLSSLLLAEEVAAAVVLLLLSS